MDRLFYGALFGIGFALAIGLAFKLYGKMDDDSMEREDKRIRSLTIVDHKDHTAANNYLIMGTIRNDGNHKIENINMEAEFFLAGKYVDECRDMINARIAPKESDNFKMSCKTCDGEGYPPHDSYKLIITSLF